jgi:hypothetical protein
MNESAFNDNDPSVYKTHILYVIPSDPNCSKLVSALEGHPLYEHIFTQDVGQLKQRPSWLDGVPMLVNKANSQAHKGKNIYSYVKEWKSDELLPAHASTGGYASFEDNGEHELGDTHSKSFSSLYDSGMFTMDDDGTGESGAGGGNGASPGGRGGAGGGGGPAGGGGGGGKRRRRIAYRNTAKHRR